MAMIVHSASSPATSNVPPDPSSRPRLLSASAHSLNYIPIGEGSPAVQHKAIEGTIRSVVPSKPKCCRKLLRRFENEARKHDLVPVSSHTAKLTRRTAANVSVFERLADHRPSRPMPYDQNLTFSPKLNPLSIRLAQERSEKLEEIQSKSTIAAAAKQSKIYANCTFKPVMSERSLQLAQNIEAGFLTRQQLHLKKKQKFIEDTLNTHALCQKSARVKPTPLPPPPPIPRRHLSDTNSHLPHMTTTSSPNTPPQPYPLAKNQRKLASMTAKDPMESPAKRFKKHNRSLTVPALSRQRSYDSLTRVPPQTNRPKMATTTPVKPLEKKSPPSLMVSPPDLSNSDSLMQKDFKKLNDFQKTKRIKITAEKISRAKKIFLVQGGYKSIRRALRNRGWVESEYYMSKAAAGANKNSTYIKSMKQTSNNTHKIDTESSDDDGDGDSSDDDSDHDIEESDSEEEREDEQEYILLSRALKHVDPTFIWTLRRRHNYLRKEQVFNHFSRALFTTKCGLHSVLHYLNSFAPVDRHTFFPRCYELTSNEDRDAFIDDYRLTAAMNIVKIVACEVNAQFAQLYEPPDKWSMPRVNVGCATPLDEATPTLSTSTHSLHPHASPSQISLSAPTTPVKQSTNNQSLRTRPQSVSSLCNLKIVPEECITLAIRACEGYVKSKENTDIDQAQIDQCPKLTDSEWNTVLTHYYSLVSSDGVLFCSPESAMITEELLEQISFYHPQLSMDGIRNLWILKPGSMSRGRGIVCKDNLSDILTFVKPSLVGQWIVQKYIEQPLLIHNTKFDIRQWFLVTDWNPLTMWIYRSSYLRFSSQVYSSQNLDRSIHLCNNSVQKHIPIGKTRSNELPTENMWSNESFIAYLRERGEADKWESVIYPGMIEAIKHVLLVSQDFVEDRKNTFELFGADFMITADYNPWLIEINCSPAMERNTAVTKKMCKEVMEDTIKVVVDRRTNKNADTGNFELVFKQAKLEVRQYVGMNLCVEGTSMERRKGYYNLKPKQPNATAIDLGKNFNFDCLKRSPF